MNLLDRFKALPREQRAMVLVGGPVVVTAAVWANLRDRAQGDTEAAPTDDATGLDTPPADYTYPAGAQVIPTAGIDAGYFGQITEQWAQALRGFEQAREDDTLKITTLRAAAKKRRTQRDRWREIAARRQAALAKRQEQRNAARRALARARGYTWEPGEPWPPWERQRPDDAPQPDAAPAAEAIGGPSTILTPAAGTMAARIPDGALYTGPVAHAAVAHAAQRRRRG